MYKSDQKIAFFLPSLRGGGTERVMVTLANSFYARGYSVDLVLASAEGPYLNEVGRGVQVVALGCSRILTSFCGLVRYLRRERPVVMLSAMWHANIIALLARMFARVPTRVIVSERNHFSVSTAHASKLRGRFLSRHLSQLYRHADGIIAVSAGVADDLAEHTGLPREDIDVVYNPVFGPTLQARACEGVAYPWLDFGQGPLILAMGRLTRQKGFSVLLRSFARVRAQRPVRLAILGEGELRHSLEEEVVQLGLVDDVALPGFVDNPFPLIRQADLFVLSSFWEGLPNGLIQAMACGTPVVATDCPSGPMEILENGRWGQLVPMGDDAALAEAMAAALNKREHPDVVFRAAEFSVDCAVEDYLRVMLPAAGN